MDIDLVELEAITKSLFAYLKESGLHSISCGVDYYWQIPAATRYDHYDEPSSFTMGQLSEDLAFLRQIETGERPPSAFALVWLSSLLQYVGERIVQ